MAVLAIMWHQKRLNFNKKPAAQSAAQLPAQPAAQPAAMVTQPAPQPAAQPAAMVAQPAAMVAQPVAQPAAQPAAQLPAKSRCSLDSQCASGACGRATAADGAPLECCAGEKINVSNFPYCKDLPNGSACWSDNMCTNGLCIMGHCSGNIAVGAPCAESRECNNGACGRKNAYLAATCCPSGNVINFGGTNYCMGMPNNTPCKLDMQCLSNNCHLGPNGGVCWR